MFITFEVQEHIYRSTMRLKTISAQNDQGGAMRAFTGWETMHTLSVDKNEMKIQFFIPHSIYS